MFVLIEQDQSAEPAFGDVGPSHQGVPFQTIGYWRADRQTCTVEIVGDLADELGVTQFSRLTFAEFDALFESNDGPQIGPWLERGSSDHLSIQPGPVRAAQLEPFNLRLAAGSWQDEPVLSGEFVRSMAIGRSKQASEVDDAMGIADIKEMSLRNLTPQILQTLPDPVFVFELGKGWVFANPMACQLLANPPTKKGASLKLDMPKGFKRMMLHMHERVIANSRASRIEFYAKHREHGLRWWSGLWAPLTDEAGDLKAVFVLHRDVTEQTELHGQLLRDRKKLHVLATTDPLTRLSNRRSFLEGVGGVIAAAGKQQCDLAIILLDIDHFKLVNDTHGHAAGDQVLKVLADVTRRLLRPHDLLARWGGEEFIICLSATDEAGALQIAERIRQAIAEHQVHLADLTLNVTVSLGVACEQATKIKSRVELESVINTADAALYRSKARGRNIVTNARELSDHLSDDQLANETLDSVIG